MGSRPFRAPPTAEELVGPLEYACLSALWRRGSGSVGQVRADLNSLRPDRDELAYTTVMTVLGRLHGKGVLDREKQGRSYRYVPSLTEAELIERLSRQAIDHLLSRYGNVAVAQFASAVRDMSDEHVALLRELVERDAEEVDDRDADA